MLHYASTSGALRTIMWIVSFDLRLLIGAEPFFEFPRLTLTAERARLGIRDLGLSGSQIVYFEEILKFGYFGLFNKPFGFYHSI